MHGKQFYLIYLLLGSYGCQENGIGEECPRRRDPYTNRCFEVKGIEMTCQENIGGCPPLRPSCGRPNVYVYFVCIKQRCVDVGCCDGYIPNEAGECISEEYIASVKCQNGATKTQFGVCLCTKHFKGSRCEIPDCGGSCQNGGSCVPVEGITKCVCSSLFYSGQFCQELSCVDKCRNGGECHQNGIWSRCTCTLGYQGDLCQFPIREECQVVESSNYRACVSKWNECETDEQCNVEGGYTACCFNGCRGVCRKPQLKECHHNGMEYHLGEIFSPNSCEECVCQLNGDVTCTTLENKPLQCPNDQYSIMVPEHCCQICSGMETTDNEVPRFTNCPEQFIVVNVTEESDTADLPPLYLTVMNLNDSGFDIFYSPKTLRHSHQGQIKDNINIVTAFTQCDPYGRRAKCNFRAIVLDPFPPVLKTCPSAVHADHDLEIDWNDPEFIDNVGVDDIVVSGDWIRGRSLPRGIYTISYTARDYDMNTAVCSFQVHVKEQSYENEVFNESENETPVGTIFGIGGAVLVFVGMSTCFIMRMSKSHPEEEQEEGEDGDSSNSANAPDAEQPPDLEENHDRKLPNLPEYSPSSEPPTYDEIEQNMSDKLSKTIYEEINETTTPIGELTQQENETDEINGETTPTREQAPVRNEAASLRNEADERYGETTQIKEQTPQANEVREKGDVTPQARKPMTQGNETEEINDIATSAYKSAFDGKRAAETNDVTTPARQSPSFGKGEEVDEIKTPIRESVSSIKRKSLPCENTAEEINEVITHVKKSALEENGIDKMNEVATTTREYTSSKIRQEEINAETASVTYGKAAENIKEVATAVGSKDNEVDISEINDNFVDEVQG